MEQNRFDSPLLPARKTLPPELRIRIVRRADAYRAERPALQDLAGRAWWAEYCLDRIARGMAPLDIATREDIDPEHFTREGADDGR